MMLDAGTATSSATRVVGPDDLPTNSGYITAIPSPRPVAQIQVVDIPNEGGAVVQDITYPDRIVDYQMDSGLYLDQSPVWRSSSSAIASIDNTTGFLKYNSSGSTDVSWTSGPYQRSLTQVLNPELSSTKKYWGSWVAGSLMQHMCDQVDNRIAGKTLAVNGPVWSSFNPAGGIFIRNPNCWSSDIAEMEAIPAAFTDGSNWSGMVVTGTLIAPNIALTVSHIGPGLGLVGKYVSMAGEIFSGTITNVRKGVGGNADLAVVKLSWDKPHNLHVAKFLPTVAWRSKMAWCYNNPTDYLGAPLERQFKFPMFYSHQDLNARIYDTINVQDASTEYASPPTSFRAWSNSGAPIDAQRLAFYRDVYVGDSGRPAMAIVNGQGVLMNLAWSVSGFQSATVRDPIIAAAASMGETITLQDVDISGFPSYS
jgi:hypothetical protein